MSENVLVQIRRSRLALALVTGQSVKNAAEQAGVCERTAHRALRNPRFLRRLRHLHAVMRQQVLGQLTEASVAAVKALRDMLEEGTPASTRLGAAKAILEYSTRMAEVVDLEDRIAALEGRGVGRADQPT
jgi:hypothetical protein